MSENLDTAGQYLIGKTDDNKAVVLRVNANGEVITGDITDDIITSDLDVAGQYAIGQDLDGVARVLRVTPNGALILDGGGGGGGTDPIPTATTSRYGITILENDVTNQATDRAATPNAVRVVNEKAMAAQQRADEAYSLAEDVQESNSFGTIGGVTSDSPGDILIFEAGTGMKITPNPNSGSITFESTGGTSSPIPDGTLTQKGIIQLSNVIEVDDSKAATPSSVKQAYDAGTKMASITEAGQVQLSDAVTSASTEKAATPNAVKKAYDKGVAALEAANNNAVPDASETVKGKVSLNDTLTSGSVTEAATANAVRRANANGTRAATLTEPGQVTLNDTFNSNSKDVVPTADALRRGLNERLALTGGTMTGALKRQYMDRGGIRSYTHIEAMYFTNGPTQGAIKIILPKKAFAGTAFKMVIQGRNHLENGEFKLTIAAASNIAAQTWMWPNATLEGNAPFNMVTFGVDGENQCIILGPVTATWSYQSLWISELYTVLGQDLDGWETGWSMVLTNNISNVTKTVTPTLQRVAMQSYADTKLALSGGDMTGAIKRTYNSLSKKYKNIIGEYITHPGSMTQGAIKIKLPKIATLAAGTAVSLEVQGYNRLQNSAFKVFLSAYFLPPTGTWDSVTTIIQGSAPFSTITLGFDSSDNPCCILGGVDTVWNFPNIEVSELAVSRFGTDGWNTGWTIELVTDISNIVKTVTPTMQRVAMQSYVDNIVIRGTGSPEGIVTRPIGSLYLRSDGGANTTLYVKESGTGNIGWVTK